MNNDLEKAMILLKAGDCTCVLCRDDNVYIAREQGVRPLVAWLDEGRDFTGFSAADKVVGKAAALLYCLLGVTAVYAPVMSQAARTVLQTYGIAVQTGQLVPAIENRTKTGLCPMEIATAGVSDPADALAAIRKKLAQLMPSHPA